MFGKPHDIDNSFSHDCEGPTRDVADLKIELENALEEAEAYKRLSLKPIVLKYELDLRELKMKMNLATSVPGELCMKNIKLWDDEIQTITQFIEELLKGAHEVL